MHNPFHAHIKSMTCGFIVALALLFVLPHGLAVDAPAIAYEPSQGVCITAQSVAGEWYLFLPSTANLSALQLTLPDTEMTAAPLSGTGKPAIIQSNVPFDLTLLYPSEPSDHQYSLSLCTATTESPIVLNLMHSANIASLYLISDDPLHQGRAWLEGKAAKEVETTGSMLLMREDGGVIYNDTLRQIRGRGHTTWEWGDKRPYQIKLEQKTDLLENQASAARTWVLMADAFDATHLHNAVTLDLGQALGLQATAEYRFVDLYYDGQYRGLYLLCEKTEVDRARLDIANYDQYIEKLYPNIDNTAAFPPAQGSSSTGAPYQYTQNVTAALGEHGAYLLELDQYNYQQAPCWFQTNRQNAYEIQSPKHASMEDVKWLSRFMQELEDTVSNQGVHPTNGNTLEHYLDLPSIARFLLVNQFAKTADFCYTSTFFYIPENESKLYGGPLWDFDIAYAMRDTRPFEGGTDGYIPEGNWLRELMSIPTFQEVFVQCFQNELLPLVRELLTEDDNATGRKMRSLDSYVQWIEPSRRMNDVLWELGGHYNNINPDTLFSTFEENLAYFRNYLTERITWMETDLSQWAGTQIEHINVAVSYLNANITEYASVSVSNQYANCTVQGLSWTADKIADEPWHTLYTAHFVLVPNKGSTFAANATVSVNACAVTVENTTANELALSFRFVGPTFEPAVYDGVDYALLFNADYFAKQNPDAAQECGDDAEALLAYYVDYALPEGVSAIETFDFDWFLKNYEKILDSYYMSDPYGSTLHYLEHVYSETLLALESPVLPKSADS